MIHLDKNTPAIGSGTEKSGHLSCIFRESVFQWSGSRLVVASSEWIRSLKGGLTDNRQPYQTWLDAYYPPLTCVHKARKTVALLTSASPPPCYAPLQGGGILNNQLLFVGLLAPRFRLHLTPEILQKLRKRTTAHSRLTFFLYGLASVR